jgi:hypothetical protein
MPDPADMIVPLLREMRTENAKHHAETHARLAALDSPLTRLESEMRKLESRT